MLAVLRPEEFCIKTSTVNDIIFFYRSTVLSSVEQKYSVPEKEALVILHCPQRMRTLVLGQTVYIHTDHCTICGMLQKPVNNRRFERVASLIQEYQIARMKLIDGRSNCLADYLSRSLDDPLFDILYGLESKLPLSSNSDSDAWVRHTFNFVSTMTLRPRNKSVLSPTSNFDDNDASVSVVESHNLDGSATSDPTCLTTVSSPNIFDPSALQYEQRQDTALRRIIYQVNNNRHTQPKLSSSFTMKNSILHKLLSPVSRSTRKIAAPCLPASMIRPELRAIHDDPYQGEHFSTDKMLSKLRSRHWRP